MVVAGLMAIVTIIGLVAIAGAALREHCRGYISYNTRLRP
jgi:hypothetical protein